MKQVLLIFVLSISIIDMYAQDSLRVAFYNVENLFDTVDQEVFNDEFYTPDSDLKWDTKKYYKKLDRIASVIEMLDFPHVMGFAEVENRQVIEDLLKTDVLNGYSYDIVHFDTRDFRGIDCALIYRKDVLSLQASGLITIQIDDPDYTGRDVLEADLLVNGYSLKIAVVHWPSRSGGLDKTNPRRWSAARQVRKALQESVSEDHVLIMGDFNDEPFNKSIKDTLGASLELTVNEAFDYYNLAAPLLKYGLGTYNYRGNWNLLDQMIGNRKMLDCSDHFCALPMKILKDDRLLYKSSRFGFTPNRTAGGPNYYGGYSDHLPIYTTLIIPQ